MDLQSSRETSRLCALLWVAPCIGAWSLIPKVASSTGTLDSLGFLFWSSLVSAACLLLCTAFSGNWRNLRAYSGTDLRRIAALAALGTFGYYALLYSAYAHNNHNRIAIVIITQYTWPALAVLWSVALLREKVTSRLLLSLIVGIVAVSVGAGGAGAEPDTLSKLPRVALAAVVFGLYTTLLKRVDYEPYSSMAVSFLVAAVLSLVTGAFFLQEKMVAWFSVEHLSSESPALVSVLVNGVFANGLSYVCWYRALRAAPVTFVAPWVALTPVLAAVVAEPSIEFHAEHWAGIILVLVSALLATVEPKRAATERRPQRAHRYTLAEESR
jgi:drug/metabolite transporter (DMT)-like permease